MADRYEIRVSSQQLPNSNYMPWRVEIFFPDRGTRRVVDLHPSDFLEAPDGFPTREAAEAAGKQAAKAWVRDEYTRFRSWQRGRSKTASTGAADGED